MHTTFFFFFNLFNDHKETKASSYKSHDFFFFINYVFKCLDFRNPLAWPCGSETHWSEIHRVSLCDLFHKWTSSYQPVGLHYHNHWIVGDKIGAPAFPCHPGISAVLLPTSLAELLIFSMGNKSRTACPCNNFQCVSFLCLCLPTEWEVASRDKGLYLNTCFLLHSGSVTFLHLWPEIKICLFEHNYRKTQDNFKAFIVNTALDTIFRAFLSPRPTYVECPDSVLCQKPFFTDVFLVSIIPQVGRKSCRKAFTRNHIGLGRWEFYWHEAVKVDNKFCMDKGRIINWDQHITMGKIQINVILCYKNRQKDRVVWVFLYS